MVQRRREADQGDETGYGGQGELESQGGRVAEAIGIPEASKGLLRRKVSSASSPSRSRVSCTVVAVPMVASLHGLLGLQVPFYYDGKPNMLHAADVVVEVAGRIVVRNASLMLHPGDKLGLVGRNGAGKTSFLQVLAGDRAPESGTVRRRGALGYLRQDPRVHGAPPDTTAVAHILSGRGRVSRGPRRRIAPPAATRPSRPLAASLLVSAWPPIVSTYPWRLSPAANAGEQISLTFSLPAATSYSSTSRRTTSTRMPRHGS